MNPLGERLPPLTNQEAAVESNRCLFCFDAPCTRACPTHIDVPRFIKKIATGNLVGSARTILESNLLGATCSRVCPVEELCEGACVLKADHKPIHIGRLQRHAMDYAYSRGLNPLPPIPALLAKAPRIAVIGAGPAGLSCAGELTRRGYNVTIFERRPLGGGLSTYGIIALREPVPVALAEVDMIARMGVKIEAGVAVGEQITPVELRASFEAIFVATGLAATPLLGIPGEEHILDGLEYIEHSKVDVQRITRGRTVLVIGAGNTAIDCATIAKRLGAEHVKIVYRRTQAEMSAYPHEYEFAKSEGIEFQFQATPAAVISTDDKVTGLQCNGSYVIPADQIIKAIGQLKTNVAELFGLQTERGFIQVDGSLHTSQPRIFAGGDCIRAKGAASTVMAVQDGKIAAGAIHNFLEAQRG